MNTPMHKETFEKIVKRLTEFVVLGKAHLEIGRGIGKAITADAVISDVAPVFWGMSITAHLDAAQMLAFKLFDSRRGSLTIEYLLNRVTDCGSDFQKAAPTEVSALVRTSRAQISAIEEPLKRIRARRNRILAHVDPTIVTHPERVAKETEIRFVDLNRIFDTAGNIVNSISSVLLGGFSLLELMGESDYENAVQLIVDAKHDQADCYEKEFSQIAPFPRPKSTRSSR
ncbi:MAG: AbiU2 domain-containing protein [Candidatus Acidiferrales bacterium]